jgi:dTDP-4-dehydrorhamnose reductase
MSAMRAELDITDRWRLEAEIERLQPTVVINAAAISDVDLCEREPELARLVNTEGPRSLAVACRNAGVRLIHFSTDYVFGGESSREYDEADPPGPVNEYGRSKLLGEMAVLETLVEAVVLRVSFVFGHGRKTFLDKILERAADGSGPIPVVDGWVSRPTSTEQICAGVELVLGSDVTGVWHLACPPAVSRAAFAREVLTLSGEDPGRAAPHPASDLKLEARRPEFSALSTARFERRFGPVIRTWSRYVGEYLTIRRNGTRGDGVEQAGGPS